MGPTGLPEAAEGLEELLQRARLSLELRRGKFPYQRELGSRLWQMSSQEEHKEDRALALANEALLRLPGIRAKEVEITQTSMTFTIDTPLGEGEVEIGNLSGDS